MKKMVFTMTVFASLLLGCPNNIQNRTAPPADELNAKTILLLQNQSSLPLANIKYCGKETSALTPGGTWTAKFTDAAQGYIYFDLELGGSKVTVRTQETVIIEKDKKQTFNITDNTVVINKEKPITLSAMPKNYVLEGGIFDIGEHPETHEKYYHYFLNGQVYYIGRIDNKYKKQYAPMTYQGNVITSFYLDYKEGNVQHTEHKQTVTVTEEGMEDNGVLVQPRVTDSAVIQAVKDTPVSQPPSLNGCIFFEKEIKEDAEKTTKIYSYFYHGDIYFIVNKDNKYIKLETRDRYIRFYNMYFILLDDGGMSSIEVQDDYIIDTEDRRCPRITDSTIIQAVKDAPAVQQNPLHPKGCVFLWNYDNNTNEKVYRYFSDDGIVYSVVYKDNNYTKHNIDTYDPFFSDPHGYVTINENGVGIQVMITEHGMIKKRRNGYFTPRVTDPAVIQAIKDAPVSQP
ncbi:MAG: hypothetical protein P1P65_02210 [Treponema sp.]